MLVAVLSLNACWGFALFVARSCVLGQWILHVFPQCAEEQKQDCTHSGCQAAVLVPGNVGFTRFFTDSAKKASKSALEMGLLDVKNLNQLHCCLGYVRSAWKHLESPDWGHFTSVCIIHICRRPPERRLQMLETPQHSEPFTGLSTQIRTHAPQCPQRNTQSKLISAIINLELCYNPGDGSGVTKQPRTELSSCSQIPFVSLQICCLYAKLLSILTLLNLLMDSRYEELNCGHGDINMPATGVQDLCRTVSGFRGHQNTSLDSAFEFTPSPLQLISVKPHTRNHQILKQCKTNPFSRR